MVKAELDYRRNFGGGLAARSYAISYLIRTRAVSRSQLRYWHECGYLVHTMCTASGGPRYSRLDVVRLDRLLKLIAAGFSLRQGLRALEVLVDDLEARP